MCGAYSFFGSGIHANVRAMARIGFLYLHNGKIRNRQIIPESWISDILESGDPEAWNASTFVDYFPGLDMHYRAKWYVERGTTPLLMGLGIHGQNLFIDPASEIVIAKFSSQGPPLDVELIGATRAAVNAVRKVLS